ncbi:MAG: dihydroneopterin aldolase [Planctomycetota bacterium]
MSGDFIDIEDLTVRTVIGIFADERTRFQDVMVSLRLYVDCERAGTSDEIAHALDYKQLTKRIIEVVHGARFFLIEKLAATVADVILREFAVPRVRVRIEKPGALRHARTVAVTIERSGRS